MKEARHHIMYVGRVHAVPVRREEHPREVSPAGNPPSLLRMLVSFGDGLDEDSLERWSETLRPSRHRPS